MEEFLQKRPIVGFEEETEDFINLLTEESNELRIGSIVGMAGLGKTSLARKIFEDSRIKEQFPTLIWVYISDVVNMKNVCRTILKTANPEEEPEGNLITKVKEELTGKKFLIVMDDIWTKDAWNAITDILPIGNKQGRVLVTTRHMDVGLHCSTQPPHQLRFLNTLESWELLQYQVYGQLNVVPEDQVQIGKIIAAGCGGLPLSVVVIGGLLKGKGSEVGDPRWSREAWIDASKEVQNYIFVRDELKLLSVTIRRSYEKLPYELRNCFLYLGVFPVDADIPVKKLIWLWVAEGFIERREDKSLEDIALDNLYELINRNLVMVRKAKVDGQPKICHIHDMVREICKMEAENINFYREVIKSPGGAFVPPDHIHRLCIHSYVLEFFSKNPITQDARSFLCFHESPMNLTPTDVISFTKGFSLLRVYDAVKIKFPKIPIMLVQILHLRYLTLAVDQCTSIPEFISELWNLQTLILYISSRTLDMKADIWKMRHLRHLKTKASITLRKDGQGEGGENLQTLSRLSPESCTREVFSRARNLVTLGVQGNLNKLEDSKCFEDLNHLNKLKLVHAGTDGVKSVNPWNYLPDVQKFAPNLKILVLTNTGLNWRMMGCLSKLDPLEVLKLKDGAFRGNHWDATAGGFLHLKCLHIERTDLVSWTARDNSFPALSSIILRNCDELMEVPPILYDNLELMSMERVTRRAISSAEAIWNKKQKEGKSFKLEIAPADKIRMS